VFTVRAVHFHLIFTEESEGVVALVSEISTARHRCSSYCPKDL